jgi:hypothetical protein
MTNATITVPAAEVAAVLSSLQTLYAVRTEAMSSIALDVDPAITAARLRPQRHELQTVEALLDGLGWDDPCPRQEDRRLSGERGVLVQAVHDVLCDAIEDLDHACRSYPHDGSYDALAAQHERVGGVLVMLADAEAPGPARHHRRDDAPTCASGDSHL